MGVGLPRHAGCALFAIALALAISVSVVQARTGFGPGGQEYGYYTVREGAHTFFWLYYVNGGNKTEGKPLVIWIQGGPGASGTGYGNFVEMGPLELNLTRREYTWARYVNLMFIDNPVGTGFSYINGSGTYATNNSQISADLVSFTKQFLANYTEFQTVPLYIFCESYGGKMTAQFARDLYKEIKAGNITADFRGVALGDSWISPVDSVMTWAPYLLATSLVDNEAYEAIMKVARKTKKAVEDGDWVNATYLWDDLEDVVSNEAGNVDWYNILTKISASSTSDTFLAGSKATKSKGGLRRAFFRQLMLNSRYGSSSSSSTSTTSYTSSSEESDEEVDELMNDYVKKALDIPDSVTFQVESDAVFDALTGDFMKPVVDIVEELLNSTDLKVNVLSGQLDLIVDTPGTLAWVERMKWSGRDYWVNSVSLRMPMVVDGIIQGYVKSYGNFSFYWVDRSGHMIPKDNPLASVEILRRVTEFDKY